MRMSCAAPAAEKRHGDAGSERRGGYGRRAGPGRRPCADAHGVAGGAGDRSVTIGAAAAVLAPTLWMTSAITWQTAGAGRSLFLIGFLLLPLASLLILGVSRELESRAWRWVGMALAASWAQEGWTKSLSR